MAEQLRIFFNSTRNSKITVCMESNSQIKYKPVILQMHRICIANSEGIFAVLGFTSTNCKEEGEGKL